MRKTKVFLLILMIFNVALLGVLIYSLVSLTFSEKAVETTVLPASSLPQMPQSQPSAMGNAGSDGLDAYIEEMKILAKRHNVNTFFLQELFPQQVVYKFRGDILYADINEALPKNTYNWDNLAPLDPAMADWRHEVSAYNFPLTYTAPEGTTAIFGIDVSKHQGDIDWEKLKNAGVQYAFVRLGYRGYSNGEIKLDERFEEYMEGAAEAGIPVGVYFFSQAVDAAEALEEADFVLENLKDYKISWPVVFDMEEVEASSYRTQDVSPAGATDAAIAFCDKIRSAGYTPMIYGNVSWFLSMQELARLDDIDKWFAQYRPLPWYPYEFSIWQYSHTGKLDGIAGEVDLNLSFVDYGAVK